MGNLPFSIENLNSDVVREAIINGYEPKKEDLINNPKLFRYDWFVWLVFSYDPSAITIFPKENLSDMICNDALERGYIPTKDDLLNNPELFKYKDIIENLLRRDPSFIVYIDKDIVISNDVLSYVINNYNITENDFQNHPQMRLNKQLMTLIGHKYEMYLEDISDERKKEIVSDYLYEGKIDQLKNIPFLDSKFNSKMDISKTNEFIGFFDILLNEEDIDEQERYIRILDKIIDAIVNINYEKDKRNFKYNNINSLDLYIRECFYKNIEIEEISKSIYIYVNGSLGKREFISFNYILEEITKLNKLYLDGKLTNDLSRYFYNEVLNDFENRYKSEYKRYLISSIKDKFQLSNNKKESILIGRKINKVSIIIKNKEFNKLKETEKEFKLKLKEYRTYIKSIKQIRKSNIVLTDDDFSYFEDIMLSTGHLDFNYIYDRLNDKDISKIIEKKYNQFKMKYINNIELSYKESKINILDKDKIEYNYNNYIIGDRRRFYDNLADLIIKLEKDDIDKIFNNRYCIYSLVKHIIPFINLFEEFKTDDLINILIFFDKTICEIVDSNSIIKNKTFDLLLNNLSEFIKISAGFASVNKLAFTILGDDLKNEINKYEINNYLDLYIKSYNRFKGTIPRVHGRIGNYTYESANYRDVDRLLVGYIQDGSCIKLGNEGGRNTLIGCMLNENDDIILIKDSSNTLVGRMLMFRRGNMVMIAPLVTKYFNKNDILNKEFLDDISSQIINAAENNNDNIDFVFVSNQESKNLKKSGYDIYKDQRFWRIFPHSDLEDEAYLIGCSKEVSDNINENPNLKAKIVIKTIGNREEIKNSYLRQRKDIKVGATEEEINRIKVLRIELESDYILKEELKNNFKPFCSKNYKYIYSGEEWYIAIRNDNTIEGVLVPTDDPRAKLEFDSILKKLSINIDYKLYSFK